MPVILDGEVDATKVENKPFLRWHYRIFSISAHWYLYFYGRKIQRMHSVSAKHVFWTQTHGCHFKQHVEMEHGCLSILYYVIFVNKGFAKQTVSQNSLSTSQQLTTSPIPPMFKVMQRGVYWSSGSHSFLILPFPPYPGVPSRSTNLNQCTKVPLTTREIPLASFSTPWHHLFICWPLSTILTALFLGVGG